MRNVSISCDVVTLNPHRYIDAELAMFRIAEVASRQFDHQGVLGANHHLDIYRLTSNYLPWQLLDNDIEDLPRPPISESLTAPIRRIPPYPVPRLNLSYWTQ